MCWVGRWGQCPSPCIVPGSTVHTVFFKDRTKKDFVKEMLFMQASENRLWDYGEGWEGKTGKSAVWLAITNLGYTCYKTWDE